MISATDREGRCIYANANANANANAAAFAANAGAEPAAPPGGGGRGRDLAVFEGGRPVAPYREDAPGKAGRRLLTSKVPLRDGTGQVVAVLTTSFELPAESAGEAGPAARGAE
jgi:hypothetical protein